MTKDYLNYFWLVLFLHILFLFLISTRIEFFPTAIDQRVPYRVEHTTAQSFVPSYFYTGSIQHTETIKQNPTPTPPIEKIIPQSPHGIKKSKPITQTSVLAMSQTAIRQNFIRSALSHSSAEEPILLVGEESYSVNPLIKLLGRSLSAHFQYPRMEGTFGIRGKVYIRLTLHPEGYYSNVHIERSSNNEDFDRAALYAVNSAPRAIGVDKFINTPTTFLVGFIFN